jgi:hypothetical protein
VRIAALPLEHVNEDNHKLDGWLLDNGLSDVAAALPSALTTTPAS